ncbi:MAG: hypothetical protein R3F14_07775 [Polyangiaceae bacterium]
MHHIDEPPTFRHQPARFPRSLSGVGAVSSPAGFTTTISYRTARSRTPAALRLSRRRASLPTSFVARSNAPPITARISCPSRTVRPATFTRAPSTNTCPRDR